ncbi:interleukin-15 receptor subunit alpha isoform X2 [Pseudophryne corroboree]|uniref:interleukin-15 receptor subunit alpha isoform X2 n=1 Tax=Pseudophryne corroboree TaxID=495146 RepID=UPI0030816E56
MCKSTHVQWLCSPPRLAVGCVLQALMALAASSTTTNHAASMIVLVVVTLQMLLTKGSRQACSAPKSVENTVCPETQTYLANEYFRYVCKDGFKRQAGTSNLAVCFFNTTIKELEWKYGNISCIRDPSIPITPATVLNTPPTTSGSKSSHVSTFPSTHVETITTRLTTPSVKTRETPTSKTKVTQLVHDPGLTPVRYLTTIYDHTTPGQTSAIPGSSSSHASTSSTQIEEFTANLSTSAEQSHETFTSNSKSTPVTKAPGQTPALEQTTTDETQGWRNSTEHMEPQTKTIVGISGGFVVLAVVILLIYSMIRCCRWRSHIVAGDCGKHEATSPGLAGSAR